MKPIDRFAELLAAGLTTSQIAERLRITDKAAQGFLYRIRKALGPQAV